jgi:O-Antigen ligase
LGPFAITFTCFLCYGAFELVHGLLSGYSAIMAVQGFAFHYYPVCFFIGIWAGSVSSNLLPRIIRALAWFNGIYGLSYIAFLNRLWILIPGTSDVSIFGQPAGSAIAILGLLCFERRLSRVWHLLLLNLLVMLAIQVRAEYLGFLMGAVLWALLTRRVGRLAGAFAGMALLLVVGIVADISVPAPVTRGGQISTRGIAGRVVAPFDEELAQQWDPDARSQAGTTEWRMRWWNRIWEVTHDNTESAFFGQGYGYPLANLVGYKERDIRTPHSVFFYALGYGGWVGVVVFAALQFALAYTLWNAWHVSRNPFGVVLWICFLTGAFFSNEFETPFGAVPIYLLTGIAAAPLCAQAPRYAYIARSYVLQAAGR